MGSSWDVTGTVWTGSIESLTPCTEFPSKGVINFRQGHCPPGALPNLPAAQPGPAHPHQLDSSRRSNQLRPAAESNAALGFGHCCNICRLAQRRSAAWRCIDMYSYIYIYVRSVSQWQLSAWKIWKWFTLWKCSKYVLLFINYDLLEFMINVAIEIFFAPSPQMAPGGSRPPGGSGSSWLRQCLSDRYGRSYCSMPDTQMTDFHHQSWEFKHPKMWVNHQEGGVHQKNVI